MTTIMTIKHGLDGHGNFTTVKRTPLLSKLLDAPFSHTAKCKGCKVGDEYTSGFHKGWCSACCRCTRHAADRLALRARGLWVAA